MFIEASTEFRQIEQWLTILTATYAKNPSLALAKTIHFYLQRMIKHEDFNSANIRQCDYLVMQRYWHWCASAH